MASAATGGTQNYRTGMAKPGHGGEDGKILGCKTIVSKQMNLSWLKVKNQRLTDEMRAYNYRLAYVAVVLWIEREVGTA